MSKERPSKSNHPRRGKLSQPAIVAAVFLGLHLLVVFWQPNPSWGVDFLFYMSRPIQGLFILLAVLLFIPSLRRRIRSWVDAFPIALWDGGRRVWVTRTLAVLLAFAAFIALSSARHFLGDGYLLLRKLEADTLQDQSRAPLSFALIRAMHHAGRAFWETAENTYRIYSYASGVLYVLLSFPVAAALGKNKQEKSVVLAVLLTAGYMQLFFGYVENYALYIPGLLLYLLMGLYTLRYRLSLYAPALVLGMLLALHQAFAVFGPSLLFLAYRTWHHRQDAGPSWKNTAATVAALCCVPVSTAVLLGLSGIGFEDYVGRMGGRNFLPLFAEPGLQSQYRIFSLEHFLDFLNQQLLTAPVACMACALLRKRDLRHQPFLLIAAVFPLFFTFLARPEIGVFRDWDIFSLPALPLTLWVSTALMARIRAREPLFHSAFLLCGAAAFHTLFWIGLNASAGPAEDRFVHLVNRLTGISAVNGWITLGKYHGRQQNTTAALYAYERAIDADPTNPNRWLVVGNVYRETGQSANAIEYYKEAVNLRPDLALPYMNLGAAYSDMGQVEKAIEYTRRAIALQPDLTNAHMNLGALFQRTGQLAKSIEHIQKAVVLQPKSATTHGNLGRAYRLAGQHARAILHLEKANTLRPRHTRTLVDLALACSDAGQNDRAIELLKEAVAIQPEHAAAHANLGAVYGIIGRYDTGIQYLERALELQPDHARAHRNLGLIHRARGRYPEAIEHLEKALELQGGQANAMTYLNIGDTYYDMREHEKAIPYFQKAIQLDPDHANAHLLLGLAYRALKRGDQARVHFEKTLELEPSHPQAGQIRQWLEPVSEGR